MTKLSVLLLLSIGGSLITNAQISKGSILLGGQISYFSSTGNYLDGSTAHPFNGGNYAITAGKAIKENSVLGITIGYAGSRIKDVNSTYNIFKLDRYSCALFFRQYKKLAKDLYLFGEAGTGYYDYTDRNLDSSGNTVQKRSEAGGRLYLTPGISYKIYKKLQFELLIPALISIQYIGVENSSTINPEGTKGKRFEFAANVDRSLLNSVAVGFSFIF